MAARVRSWRRLLRVSASSRVVVCTASDDPGAFSCAQVGLLARGCTLDMWMHVGGAVVSNAAVFLHCRYWSLLLAAGRVPVDSFRDVPTPRNGACMTALRLMRLMRAVRLHVTNWLSNPAQDGLLQREMIPDPTRDYQESPLTRDERLEYAALPGRDSEWARSLHLRGCADYFKADIAVFDSHRRTDMINMCARPNFGVCCVSGLCGVRGMMTRP